MGIDFDSIIVGNITDGATVVVKIGKENQWKLSQLSRSFSMKEDVRAGIGRCPIRVKWWTNFRDLLCLIPISHGKNRNWKFLTENQHQSYRNKAPYIDKNYLFELPNNSLVLFYIFEY